MINTILNYSTRAVDTIKQNAIPIAGTSAVMDTLNSQPTIKNLVFSVLSTLVLKLLAKGWDKLFNKNKVENPPLGI